MSLQEWQKNGFVPLVNLSGVTNGEQQGTISKENVQQSSFDWIKQKRVRQVL